MFWLINALRTGKIKSVGQAIRDLDNCSDCAGGVVGVIYYVLSW